MTVSVHRLRIDEEPFGDLKTYCHMGLIMTAVTIRNLLADREILVKAFQMHPVC